MPQNQILLPPSATSSLRLGVAILLGLIILLAFVIVALSGWSAKRRDPHNDFYKEPTRVIGGLGVLLISIVADNAYIYAIALFIGGLLIASEKFMINLAAIFNSDRENVHKITRDWEEANLNEVAQKQGDEAIEGVEADRKDSLAVSASNDRQGEPKQNQAGELRERFALIKQVENRALSYLEEQAGRYDGAKVTRYIREFAPGAEEVKRVHDAFVSFGSSKQKNFTVEILFKQKLLLGSLRAQTIRAIAQMKSEKLPLLIFFVFEDNLIESKDHLGQFKSFIHDVYQNVGIAYFEYKDSKLTAVDEADLISLLEDVPFARTKD